MQRRSNALSVPRSMDRGQDADEQMICEMTKHFTRPDMAVRPMSLDESTNAGHACVLLACTELYHCESALVVACPPCFQRSSAATRARNLKSKHCLTSFATQLRRSLSRCKLAISYDDDVAARAGAGCPLPRAAAAAGASAGARTRPASSGRAAAAWTTVELRVRWSR